MDGLGVSQQLIHEALTRTNELVYVCLPSRQPCPNCQADPFYGESVDVTCSVCGGKGYLVTERFSAIPARVSWNLPNSFLLVGNRLVSSGETGEIILHVDFAYQHVLKAALKTEGSYALVANRKVRILSLAPNRVENLTSYNAYCVLAE